MAESIVKVPLTAESGDYDFLAFSFGGKHSYDDFGIYRVIDGDRYNDDLNPPLQDVTVETPGIDGAFYFGTTHKPKIFNINFAFDSLNETKLREMKQWLNGKELQDLWFDEAPYKVYTAKVTGTAMIKHIPFDEKNKTTGQMERIYKGEGTIQFTAYWPYAHTPDLVETSLLYLKVNEEMKLKDLITIKKDTYITIKGRYIGTIALKRGNVRPIASIEGDGISEEYSKQITAQSESGRIFDTIIYTNTQTADEYAEVEIIVINSYDKKIYITDKYDGRKRTSYSNFRNRTYWINSSGLPYSITNNGENPGDVPAPFILTDTSGVAANTSKTYKITDDLQITVGGIGQTAMSNITWDSKTGIVSARIGTNEENVPISYTGNSLGGIPVGGCTPVLNGATLQYHYWYY